MKAIGRVEIVITVLLSLLLPAGCAKPEKYLTLDLGNGVTMKLVRIEAGTFMMGSKLSAEEVAKRLDSTPEYHKDEHPRHQVTISTPFYMGVTEVTQAQWKAVMNTQPWEGKPYTKAGPDHPASSIIWDAATAFCMALSKKTGRTVRLPTEAEWEYACRAGTTTRYSFGDDSSKLGDYAWYSSNTYYEGESYAHPVGAKKPNAWGLCDMYGNVKEWCADWRGPFTDADARDPKGPATGKYRVICGWSWLGPPNERTDGLIFPHERMNTEAGEFDSGFRVVVEIK